MRILRNPARTAPCVLVLGMFDGVHRGHQQLLMTGNALAEAEGIDKKAEAMKKYGEAAVIEMIMGALPDIAKNVAEPLSKVDKITMYGEGNSAKMLQDIINSTTQVTEGLAQGMGIDVKALLSSIVGAKIASNTPEDPQKSDSDEYEQ